MSKKCVKNGGHDKIEKLAQLDFVIGYRLLLYFLQCFGYIQ